MAVRVALRSLCPVAPVPRSRQVRLADRIRPRSTGLPGTRTPARLGRPSQDSRRGLLAAVEHGPFLGRNRDRFVEIRDAEGTRARVAGMDEAASPLAADRPPWSRASPGGAPRGEQPR